MDLRAGLPAALLAAASIFSGCGASPSPHEPDLNRLPLPDGMRIVSKVRDCDKGANGYCAWQLVVVNPRYKTSADLLTAQHDLLRRHGWTGADADTGDEHAADSPGHKLRVTYATAYGELKDIDLGWVKRNKAIALGLSRALFDRSSALSLTLELGSG